MPAVSGDVFSKQTLWERSRKQGTPFVVAEEAAILAWLLS